MQQITEFVIINDNDNLYTSDHKILKISLDHPNANLSKNRVSFSKSRDTSNQEKQYNTKEMTPEQCNLFQNFLTNCEYIFYEDTDIIQTSQEFIN